MAGTAREASTGSQAALGRVEGMLPTGQPLATIREARGAAGHSEEAGDGTGLGLHQCDEGEGHKL